jgi:hypothetical protein
MENIFEQLAEITRPKEAKKDILFRCHALGKLFTEPKAKTDKEAGNLSETAKSLVLEMYLYNKYGYKERIMTDAMYKGLLCEQDSMKLVQDVLGGEFRMKNKANLTNKFISGTPDVILKKEEVVEDIKTSENLRTFYNAEITKDYDIQLQGYMMLTGLEKARLIYCLLPTPFEQITNAKKKVYYQFDCNENNTDYIEICDQIDHNNDLILKIPKNERVKVFEINRNDEIIDTIKTKVEKARQYYLGLVG